MITKTAPYGSQRVPLLYVKDGELNVLSSVTEYENGEEIDSVRDQLLSGRG
jgi:hypothetical protein